jgi:hypothetical protein
MKLTINILILKIIHKLRKLITFYRHLKEMNIEVWRIVISKAAWNIEMRNKITYAKKT